MDNGRLTWEEREELFKKTRNNVELTDEEVDALLYDRMCDQSEGYVLVHHELTDDISILERLVQKEEERIRQYEIDIVNGIEDSNAWIDFSMNMIRDYEARIAEVKAAQSK